MKLTDLPRGAHIHMMGIGGAGVSGLATVMAEMGYKVSGCDAHPGCITDKLAMHNITVKTGHDPQHISGVDMLVRSAAIPADNPETLVAEDQGIPILSRAEMLGLLMQGRYGIAVAGTHGKTTTTSMLALVLELGGLDPTVLIGGDLDKLNGNAKLGKSEYFLTEACEAFNSFLTLHPRIALINNIEPDHMDWYKSKNRLMRSFRVFLSQIEDMGCAVVNSDCPNTRSLSDSVKSRVVSFGFDENAFCRGMEMDVSFSEPSFNVSWGRHDLGRFTLKVPGEHNVRNALGAIAVCMELGIDSEVVCQALAEFKGASRRYEILGEPGDIMIVDDYAHHPTEVTASLKAARSWGRRVVAVFQPHLYSRTMLFAKEFAESLSIADTVIVTGIYAAREKPKKNVSGRLIADMIQAVSSHKVLYADNKDDVPNMLENILQAGDILLVMGAGDIRTVAETMLSRLQD